QASHLAESVTTDVNTDRVRAQVGILGVLITILSATSYSRAPQRSEQEVWALHHVGGLAGFKRSFVWLLGWLAGLQLLTVVNRWGRDSAGAGLLAAVRRTALMVLLWWWSLRFLLAERVRWRELLPAAALTGVAVVAYAAGETLDLPRFSGL